MSDPTTEGELIRLRNRIAALEASGAELLRRTEKAEAELAGMRDLFEAANTVAGARTGERDALKAAATRARGYLTRALDAWTPEHEYYQDRAGRKGYSHDETPAEVYGAAMKVVAAALAALAAPESHEDAAARIREGNVQLALRANRAEEERAELLARAKQAEAAIERVRALHSPEMNPRGTPDCKGCRTVATYTLYENCKTIAALNAFEKAMQSPAAASTAVSAATEAHGETTEPQEARE